nr:unnamed protein product [Callosobruchus chinensis]
MLQTAADFAGIHKSTTCQIIKKVIHAIASLAPEYIKMPNTQQQVDQGRRRFHRIARFPRVIGSIDCTHIRIISPGGANGEYFRNRKGYFSLNLQVVGDADLRIRDIVARWPGSTHDQTIFNNSSIKARFEANEFENAVLLGDSGYALKKYLITPIPNPTTEVEQVFNEGAVLHNIAIDRNEPEPISDLDIAVESNENEIHVGNEQREYLHFREGFLTYFMNLLAENNDTT